MEQFDLCDGTSPVVFIQVHSIVVVLKDHTSFIYTDSRIYIIRTCIPTEVDNLVTDNTTAMAPSRNWETIGLQVKVYTMPVMFIHFLFYMLNSIIEYFYHLLETYITALFYFNFQNIYVFLPAFFETQHTPRKHYRISHIFAMLELYVCQPVRL